MKKFNYKCQLIKKLIIKNINFNNFYNKNFKKKYK